MKLTSNRPRRKSQFPNSDARIFPQFAPRLNRDFLGTTFYFLPADIVSQTINFGLPASKVWITGRWLEAVSVESNETPTAN